MYFQIMMEALSLRQLLITHLVSAKVCLLPSQDHQKTNSWSTEQDTETLKSCHLLKWLRHKEKKIKKKYMRLVSTFKMGGRTKTILKPWDMQCSYVLSLSVTSGCPAAVWLRRAELRFEQGGPTDGRCLGSITHMLCWRDKGKCVSLATAAAWPLTSKQPWVLSHFLDRAQVETEQDQDW